MEIWKVKIKCHLLQLKFNHHLNWLHVLLFQDQEVEGGGVVISYLVLGCCFLCWLLGWFFRFGHLLGMCLLACC